MYISAIRFITVYGHNQINNRLNHIEIIKQLQADINEPSVANITNIYK